MARRGRRRWAEQFSHALELPDDALHDVSRLTVVSDRQVAVENHRGLLGYFPHQVVLRVPEGRLYITGEDLLIHRMGTDDLTLSGKVTGVQYLPPLAEDQQR